MAPSVSSCCQERQEEQGPPKIAFARTVSSSASSSSSLSSPSQDALPQSPHKTEKNWRRHVFCCCLRFFFKNTIHEADESPSYSWTTRPVNSYGSNPDGTVVTRAHCIRPAHFDALRLCVRGDTFQHRPVPPSQGHCAARPDAF